MRYTFPKSEILRSKKKIASLFKDGTYLTASIFSLLWIRFEDLESNQVLISIPKKRIKTAVNRNLLKRRTKEAFRKNSGIFNNMNTGGIGMAFVYRKNTIATYSEIENEIIDLLKRLSKENNLK